MTDFIREVDEEVRQDKFKTVLNRYWYVIAALVVLILGGVGAWKAYDYYTTQKAETAGGIYLNALDASRDGKTDEAIAALDRTTFDDVAEVARGISETASVACVGPHEVGEFTT